jgi:hypothetical protein
MLLVSQGTDGRDCDRPGEVRLSHVWWWRQSCVLHGGVDGLHYGGVALSRQVGIRHSLAQRRLVLLLARLPDGCSGSSSSDGIGVLRIRHRHTNTGRRSRAAGVSNTAPSGDIARLATEGLAKCRSLSPIVVVRRRVHREAVGDRNLVLHGLLPDVRCVRAEGEPQTDEVRLDITLVHGLSNMETKENNIPKAELWRRST